MNEQEYRIIVNASQVAYINAADARGKLKDDDEEPANIVLELCELLEHISKNLYSIVSEKHNYFSLMDQLRQLAEKKQPLDADFAKALYDNLDNLYGT